MKNQFFNLAISAAVLLFSLSSCEKDETQAVLNNSASPELTASAATANISRTNGTAQAVTYSWTPAEFGYKAAVTYTLQLAKQGTNFASPQEFNVGSELSKSFTVKELNDLYNSIDCSLPAIVAPVTLEARVRASVSDVVQPSTSAVKTITASPYPDFINPTDQWGLVGPAGDGWPGATNTDRLMPYDCRVRAYVLRMPLKAGAFKFRRNQDWGFNLGGTGVLANGVPLMLNGSDLTLTTAGTYTVKLEVTTNAAGLPTGGKVTLIP